jgi:hypothetical protein
MLTRPACPTLRPSIFLPCPALPWLQLWVHILMLAFVMVILSALILTPRTRLPARSPARLPACHACQPATPWSLRRQGRPLACYPTQPARLCAAPATSTPPPTHACLAHHRAAVILFGLGFADKGFTWAHGALFAAMIASTDALSATAILKQGGWVGWRAVVWDRMGYQWAGLGVATRLLQLRSPA